MGRRFSRMKVCPLLVFVFSEDIQENQNQLSINQMHIIMNK